MTAPARPRVEGPATEDQATGRPAGERPPVVQLVGLSRSYPATPPVTALDGVDLVVAAGEYLSVVAASGTGKSTLLHVLGLLDRPTTGDYLLDGVSTGTSTEARRAALRGGHIGFVFQQFHLLPQRTVLDNVLLATLYSGVPRGLRVARARAALDRVHLGHRVEALPTTLSGGERQRVAVARAVVAEPSLLLADEPTGNLDSGSTAEVMDLFDELHADGLTLVVITHDAAVSARADRRVRISDGVLSEL